ncbi:MAG TPA: hypothetical protein VMW78_03210 [Anaerolineae bacterium]|nr:hypothetical protein [Anaerolineae bacterium]
MDIIIGNTAPVKMDTSKKGLNAYVAKRNGFRKDLRKNRDDRRKSVREGIFVFLSVKNDRRGLRERRRS